MLSIETLFIFFENSFPLTVLAVHELAHHPFVPFLQPVFQHNICNRISILSLLDQPQPCTLFVAKIRDVDTRYGWNLCPFQFHRTITFNRWTVRLKRHLFKNGCWDWLQFRKCVWCRGGAHFLSLRVCWRSMPSWPCTWHVHAWALGDAILRTKVRHQLNLLHEHAQSPLNGACDSVVMSMCLFYTRGSAFVHILTLMHFRGLQHHSDIFNTFMFSNSETSCTHVHHLQMFYHVSTHHASAHLWIFENHPHMHYVLPEPSHICRHTSFRIPSYSRNTILHLWTSFCMKAHICWKSGIIHTWHAEYSQYLWKHQYFTVPPLFLSESGHSSGIRQNPVESSGIQRNGTGFQWIPQDCRLKLKKNWNLVANTCVQTVVHTSMVYKLTFVVCQ